MITFFTTKYVIPRYEDPNDSELAKQSPQEARQRLAIRNGATCGDSSFVKNDKLYLQIIFKDFWTCSRGTKYIVGIDFNPFSAK